MYGIRVDENGKALTTNLQENRHIIQLRETVIRYYFYCNINERTVKNEHFTDINADNAI